MQPGYGLFIHSGYLYIQKSLKKQSQALKIYSTSLLYPMYSRLINLFLNLNPIL
jgi:hypothetical protein